MRIGKEIVSHRVGGEGFRRATPLIDIMALWHMGQGIAERFIARPSDRMEPVQMPDRADSTDVTRERVLAGRQLCSQWLNRPFAAVRSGPFLGGARRVHELHDRSDYFRMERLTGGTQLPVMYWFSYAY